MSVLTFLIAVGIMAGFVVCFLVLGAAVWFLLAASSGTESTGDVTPRDLE